MKNVPFASLIFAVNICVITIILLLLYLLCWVWYTDQIGKRRSQF